MNYLVEISISLFLILFIVYSLIRLAFWKKSDFALWGSLAALILFGFGIYLVFKNSLILDYGEFGKNDPTTNEIANLTSQYGQLDVIISISFLLLMIVLLVIGLIRRKTSV